MPKSRTRIASYRDLAAWQLAMETVIEIYRVTRAFPAEEKFGLISQLRRAAVSIPSNIAEGKAVGGQSYPRHVRIALGSEAEIQTQIELARRLGMLKASEADKLVEDAADVSLGGTVADEEVLGDLAVRMTGDEQPQDLLFAWRENI